MRRISSLKIAIVERGMLQADVAQEASITEAKLSRIVNGRARPSQREIKALSEVLGFSPEELPI